MVVIIISCLIAFAGGGIVGYLSYIARTPRSPIMTRIPKQWNPAVKRLQEQQDQEKKEILQIAGTKGYKYISRDKQHTFHDYAYSMPITTFAMFFSQNTLCLDSTDLGLAATVLKYRLSRKILTYDEFLTQFMDWLMLIDFAVNKLDYPIYLPQNGKFVLTEFKNVRKGCNLQYLDIEVATDRLRGIKPELAGDYDDIKFPKAIGEYHKMDNGDFTTLATILQVMCINFYKVWKQDPAIEMWYRAYAVAKLLVKVLNCFPSGKWVDKYGRWISELNIKGDQITIYLGTPSIGLFARTLYKYRFDKDEIKQLEESSSDNRLEVVEERRLVC